MKKIVLSCGLVLTAIAFAGSAPTIEVGTATQDSSNVIHIPYTLANGPAIVTLNVLTNDGTGVYVAMDALSVFGANLSATTGANTPVSGNGAHEIVWKPRRTLGSATTPLGQTKFVLKAYAVNNAPTLMAVRLAADIGTGDRVLYFASTNDLPGGVLGNSNYRQSILLLKRVRAKNRTFGADVMTTYSEPKVEGSLGGAFRKVSFTNDFYMGVFELTQQQWLEVYGTQKSSFSKNGAMRPAESMSYQEIREAASNAKDATHMYPAAPHPNSYLGKLRTLTQSTVFPEGIDFDLPSENEWEYTACANVAYDRWNDGTVQLDAYSCAKNSPFPGRCYSHQVRPGQTETSDDVDNGTAICGSYAPSAWGFYDFQGNVSEWCLDWYERDLSTKPEVFVNANGENLLDGSTAGKKRVARGSPWSYHDAYGQIYERHHPNIHLYGPGDQTWVLGFRVKAQAGLK